MALDVSALSKLTDAVDAVRKFVEKAAGNEDKDQQSSGAVPGDSAAVQMARNARQSYQKTARWMLAAFAAVGVLIFGSLPFAAIADVRVTWPSSLWLLGGLLLAVAGIVSAVIAVSLVSEPEDASLGELDCDLRAVQKVDEDGNYVFKDNRMPVITIPKIRAWWNPRLECRIELANILHGAESAAHLGPNLAEGRHATVADLIKRLGELEKEHADRAPAAARQAVVVETLEQRTAAYKELLAELRTQQADTTEISAKYTATAAELDTARQELAVAMSALAEADNKLELYQDHRNLVLAESAVMQLRGRFRLARRILAIAAVLTLFGGTGYALALPGATESKEPTAQAPQQKTPQPQPATYAAGLPATVTIHEGTRPAAELPRECVDRELQALWVGDTRIPAPVGPFTALITDPPCLGQVTVARGEGTFSLNR